MMQAFREPQSTTNAPNATSVNSFPLTQAAVSGNSLYPSQQNSPRLVVEDCRGQPPPNHTQQHPSQIAPLSHSPHPSQASLLQGYASPRRPPLDYPSGLAYRKEMADYYYLSGGKEAQRRGVPFPYSSSHSHSPSSTSSSSSSSSSSSQSSAAAAGNLDGSRPYTHPHPQRHPGLYQPENFAGANSAVASAAYSPHYGMPAQQQQQVYSQPLQQSSAALPAGVLVHQRGRFQQQQQQRLSQFGHYPHSPVLQSTGLAGPSPAASSYNPSQPQRYAGGPQQQPASGFDAYGKMKPGVYENSPQQVPCYPAGYGYRFQASQQQQQQQQLSKAYEQAKGGHSASLYPGGCGKLGNPPPALPFPSQEAASKSPVVTQQQFHQNFSPISNPSPPAAPPSSSSVAPSPTCSSTPSPLMGAPDSGGGTSQRNSRLLLQKSQVSPNHGSPGQQQQLQLLQHLPYKASPLDRLRQDKPSLDPGWSSLNALSSQVANIPNTVQHMLLSDALLSHHKRKELPPQPQPHHSVSLSGASPGSASAGRNRARKAGEAVGGGGGGGGAGGRSPVRPESRSGDLLQSPAPGSLESPGEEDPALSAAERAQRLSGQSNGSETDPCHPGAGPPRQAPPPPPPLPPPRSSLSSPSSSCSGGVESRRGGKGTGATSPAGPPQNEGCKSQPNPRTVVLSAGQAASSSADFSCGAAGQETAVVPPLPLPLHPPPPSSSSKTLPSPGPPSAGAPSCPQPPRTRQQEATPQTAENNSKSRDRCDYYDIDNKQGEGRSHEAEEKTAMRERGQLEEEEEEEEEEESESPASRPRRSQPAGRKPDDDGGPAPSSPRPRSADTGGSIRVIVSARSEQAPQTREQNRTGSQEQDYHPRHNGQGAAHRQHHGPAPCPGYADDQPGHRQHHRPGKSVLETPGRQEERQRRQRPLQPQPQHFPSLLQEVLQGYHFLDRRYSQRPDQAAAPPNCAPSSARPPGTEHVPPGKYPVGGGRAEQVWGGGAAGGWGDKKGVLLPEQQDFPQRSVEQTSAAKHIDLADYSLIRKPLEREKGVGKATREPSAVKTPPSASPRYLAASSTTQQLLMRDSGEGSGESERDWPPPAASVELLSERRSVICDVSPSRRTPERDRRDPQSSTGVPQTVIHPPAQATLKEPVSDTVSPNPVASKEMDRTPGLGLGGGGGGGGERGADQPSQKPPSLHHFPHHHSQKASASPNSVPGTPEHKDSRTVQHRARMQQQLHRDEALGALPPGGGRLNSVLVGSGSSSSVGVASNLPYPAPAGRYHHPHPHHHQFYYPSPEAFGLGGELKHHKSLTSASSPQAQQQEQFHHQQQHSLQHPEERGREWAGFRPHRGNASGTLGQKEEEMMMMMMMSSSQPGSAGHGSSGRAGPQQQSDFYDMGVSHQHLHLQNKIWGSQLPSGHPMGDPEILKPGVRSAPKRAVPKNPQDAAPPPQSSRGFTEEMARSRRPPSNGDEGQHPNPLMMRRRVRSFISPIPAKRQHQEALTSPSPAGEGAEAHRAPQIPDNLPQMEPPASREKSGCPDAQQGAPNSGNGIGFVDPCGSASQTNAAPSPAGKTKILPPRKGRGLKLEAIVQKITSPSAKRGVAPPGVATHGAVGLGEAFAAAVAVAGDSNPSGAGISEIFGSSSAAATGGDCDPVGVFGPSLLDRKPSCLGGAAIANAVRTANADAGPSLDEILAFRCGEESFPGAPYPFRLHEGEGGEQEEEEEYEEEEDDEEFERETEKSGRRLGSDLMPLFAAAAPPLPSPALSDIRSFSSCGYNAPEPAGERDQAFPLGRRPEDFTERPPSLFACYGLPGNAVAAPLAGPAAPSGCGSPYPLGVRGGEEGKVEAGVCAPPSLVPKGYFPSGKKKGRPVGSVNKQKRASPQQQGPGGTGSAQQQQNQNQNLSQPVPQTQLSNQKPAPVLEAAPPPPPPPPSTTFPCPDVDFSTAVPHADPNPSGESFAAPNEAPKPRRRRQRKPAGGEEAEEEEGEQSGVRQRRRRRRRRGGKSAESKPLEEEEEQEPGGGEPQKRGSFMPYVHVERKLPEAGSLCTVVNEEEEAEVQKRPGAFPLAAQPEDQDLSAVVLSSQQPSPSSSSPSSSPGLGKSFPASSYVLPGPVVTESPVLGRLLCCLCGKWANFKNLGDLYGPYYPADYATSLPKNQPQSSRQARPGTGAGGVSVSPSCLKQEPEEESQGSPGKEKVRHKSAEVKPLPSSSLPCSAEEGRTKGEEEEREGEEKQEPPFLPSATNPAAGDGEPVFPAPTSSLATAGGSGHRKPTTHPRFKRRHRSNEEPLPPAGSSSSRSQTKPEPETDPLPAPAPAPIPQVPLDGRELWIHEACVVWASGVFLVCGRLYGLQEALEGARETLCSHCQQCGSTLGCYSKGCSLRYHYVCAIDTDCSLNEDNFSMRCPKHKVKCVRVISSEQSERG